MLLLYSNNKINEIHFTKNKQKSCRRKFVIYFYDEAPHWKILLGPIGLKTIGAIKISRTFANRNFKLLCITNLSLYEFILLLAFIDSFSVVKQSQGLNKSSAFRSKQPKWWVHVRIWLKSILICGWARFCHRAKFLPCRAWHHNTN